MFSLVVGFELVIFLVLWLGGCLFPGGWVGDWFGEVKLVEWVHAWYVDVVGYVVCGAQKFQVSGKGLVLGLELDGHCCCLFFS